ncbi:hypothetical protein ABZ553_14440 [Streptomyces sparsogenes]|uniref:hypothetical protein n=1 Tax=Streptomyces sparsogenes TaxID=67365 RepID=UPI00340610AC
MSARDEQCSRIAAIADREHTAWIPSSSENLKDKRTLGERIADVLLAEGVIADLTDALDGARAAVVAEQESHAAYRLANPPSRTAAA